MSYQIVILQGNLTRDAEVRQVGQNQVAQFSVATSRRFKKADGSVGEESEFHDIELWNQTGVFPYLKKGTALLVQGEIKTDKWTDQQGQQRSTKKIRAAVVQLCGPRPQPAAPAPQPAAPQYQQAPAPRPQYAPQPQAPAPAPQPTYPQYAHQPQAPAPQYEQQGAPMPPQVDPSLDLPF